MQIKNKKAELTSREIVGVSHANLGKRAELTTREIVGVSHANLGKRAELTTREIVELILVVAGLALVIFLTTKFISPIFDSQDETSKAYLETLKEQIKYADDGSIGRFEIFDFGESENYELVYFGEALSLFNGEYQSLGDHKNHICICVTKDEKSKCNSCTNLDYPADGLGNVENFIFKKGTRLEIKKLEGYYEFKKI